MLGVGFAIECRAQTNAEINWGYRSNIIVGNGLPSGSIRPVRFPTNGHFSGSFTNITSKDATNAQDGSIPPRRKKLPPPAPLTQAPNVSIPTNLVQAPIEINASSFTNGLVSRENYLPTTTKYYEQALANPHLDPNVRRAYERLLEDSKEKQMEFQTNSQLWAKLFEARKAGNPAEVTKAKQELADYLAAFSDKKFGKKYPMGTGLETIMEDYKERAGASSSESNRRRYVRILMATVVSMPLAFGGIYYLRRHKKLKRQACLIK